MRLDRIRSSHVCWRWARESALLIQIGNYQFGFRVGKPSFRESRREIRVHAGFVEYILSWGDR